MNVSCRYILGLFLGLLAGIGVFIALLYSQLGIPTESSQFAYDIIQKKKAISASIPGPRLLLVGGSSVLFGLNAKMIEEQTGRRTVNMGTHAGLGLDYILYLAKKVARPGDTILIVIEYELYTGRPDVENHDDFILARDPEFFRQMSLLDKVDMATRVPFKRFQKGFRNARVPEKALRPDPPYTEAATYLNDHGDEIGNSEAVRGKPGPNMRLVIDNLIDGIPSDDTTGFNALRKFLAWAKANHITVLATFPNTIYRPEYDQPQGEHAIKVITDFYTSQGVPVIGTAREAMLPSGEFFDTLFHLTLEGAQRRTLRFLPELKPFLDSPQ